MMKIKLLLTDGVGRFFLIPSIALPILTNLQIGLIVLFVALAFDFFTGVLASYIETKKGIKAKTESGLIFESSRARESVVKAVGYLSLVLLSFAAETLFFQKHIAITTISDSPFRLTELVVGFCIAIEAYSAIIENMKRAGFDILGKAKKIVKSIYDFTKKVKGE